MDKTQEAAHTPGPWEIHQQPGRPETLGHFVTADGLTIAEVTYQLPSSVNGKVMESTRVANARLIAAAPELLEALQAIKKIFDKDVTFIGGGPQSRVEVPFESHDQSWNHWHEARDLIRAAIAKATGAAAPAAPSLALTAFIQDVEAAEGKATGSDA